jgi:predicted transcriptional regulator of viral defense system
VERVVQALADRQHGVVARRQLLEAGLTGKAVRGLRERGWLVPLHRGVYAVGHRRLRREAYWLAAVLASGPGSALSHRDAAALHGLRPSNRATVDVTTADRGHADRPGITLHRAVLDAADRTTLDAIPVTTVARTLVDLADTLAPDHLAKALSEAERLNVLDLTALEQARARTRGRRGSADRALRAALAEHAHLGATLTRSSLEDAFRALLRQAGLPAPRTNAALHGHEVDALWPDQRLVAELDGYAFHHGRRAFQDDRAKDAALAARGYLVVRFTHDDVVRRGGHVAATLRQLLAAPSEPRATMSAPCR